MSPHVTGGPQGAVLIVLGLPKFCRASLEAEPMGLEDQVIEGWRCWKAALVSTMPTGSTSSHITFLSALGSEGSSVRGL